MKRLLILICILILIITSNAWSQFNNGGFRKDSFVPSKLGTNLQGQEVKSSTFDSKVLIIYRWTAEDPNLDSMFSYLENLYQKYNSIGLEICFINIDQANQVANLANYINRYNPSFMMLFDEYSFPEQRIIVVNHFGMVNYVNETMGQGPVFFRKYVIPRLQERASKINLKEPFSSPPPGKRLYLSIKGNDGALLVIDTKTNQMIDRIQELTPELLEDSPFSTPTKVPPYDVVVSPEGKYYFVSLQPSSVTALETSTDRALATRKIEIKKTMMNGGGVGITDISITPDGAYLLAVCTMAKGLQFISLENFTLENFIQLSISPTNVYIAPDGKYAYVDNNIINIANQAVDASIDATILATSLDDKYGYATSNNKIQIFDLETKKLNKEFTPTKPANKLFVSPDGTKLYTSSGEIYAIPNHNKIGQVSAAGQSIPIIDIAFTGDINSAYIINSTTLFHLNLEDNTATPIPVPIIPDLGQEMNGLSIVPDPTPFQYAKAIAALNEGNYEEAIIYLEKVLSVIPEHIPAQSALAQVYLKQNQIDKSLDIYNTLIQLEPDNKDLYRDVANIYLDTNRIDDAIKVYQDILKIDPNDINTHNALANLYLEQNNNTQAIMQYENIMQLQPQNAKLQEKIARMYLKNNQMNKAIDALQKTLQITPDNIALHRELSQLHLEQNQHEQAITQLKSALQNAPNDIRLHEELGKIYLELGRIDEAQNEFAKAGGTIGGVELHIKLGESFQTRGDIEKAITEYEIALEIEPNYNEVELFASLGELYLQQGTQLKKAEDMTNKAININPNKKYHYLNTLATIYKYNGDNKKAIETWEEAIELTLEEKEFGNNKTQFDNTLADYYYVVGTLYDMQNDEKKAYEHLGNALSLVQNQDWQSEVQTRYNELTVILTVPDKPEPDKPIIDKPEPDKPIIDKPEPDKPIIDKPEPDKPIIDKPEPDKPIIDKPEPDKPIITDKTPPTLNYDIAPKLLNMTPPIYPSGLFGTVILRIKISIDGNVEDVNILQSDAPEECEQIAIATVKTWKYSPAKYKNKPIETWIGQSIIFQER